MESTTQERVERIERTRDVFLAASEFYAMTDEPEFREDYDGMVRTWMRETPRAIDAAQRMIPAWREDAMNPLPGVTAEQWGFALNTFWALRSALDGRAVGR